jgi:MFS family permease
LVDIYPSDKLAVGFSLWSIAPFNGPVIGPIIGGFVYAGLGWRWDNWLTMILSGVSVMLMATIPETYAPVLLRKRAARLRKEQDSRYWSRYDDKTSFWSQLKVTLGRPFILAATEPILWFFNTWSVAKSQVPSNVANKRIKADVVPGCLLSMPSSTFPSSHTPSFSKTIEAGALVSVAWHT